LSAVQQLELLERYEAGALQRELAAIYGVERRTVGEIVKRARARAAQSASGS
jgi:DNA-binding transcriptional regulator LsrR (DeoR family)